MALSSLEYWREREEAALESYLKDEDEYAKQINSIYDYLCDRIQKEIDSFYAKYAAAEGITMAEAKKAVSKLDIKEYARKAAKYVADKDFSAKANAEMRLYNATMKINRLELLKSNIGLEMVSSFDELDSYMGGILTDRARAEFKRQAGILGDVVQNIQGAADSIVNGSFKNATFSDRIWMYQDLLKASLTGLLSQGLIQGRNPKALAKDLRNLFGVQKYQAERLMRTEMARVQIEAQRQSYEAGGYEQYIFIATLDAKTCETCGDLDGKIFNVKDMETALNAPPMHPNCRCATAAYVAREEMQSGAESGIINAGGISGALNPYSERAKRHAVQYYESVRHMTNDVNRIAKNVGWDEQDVEKIKKYIFVDEHDLTGGRKRFDESYDIAQSWQRLIEGKKIKEQDIVLLNHEYLELTLVEKGMSQDEAHVEASKKFNYAKYIG